MKVLPGNDQQTFVDNVEKLNDRIQQLALVGIGTIWLFRIEEAGTIMFREQLVVPVLLFILTLALDLAHYAVVSHTWHRWIDAKTAKKTKANSQVPIPKSKEEPQPGEIRLVYSRLLWARLVSLVIGYGFLLYYLNFAFSLKP